MPFFGSENESTLPRASVSKPCPDDSFTVKEKYILAKVNVLVKYILYDL